jgi:hypothetical protein
MRDFFHTGLQVSRSDLANRNSMNTPGQKFYVSRNVAISGDGSSWGEAFKTIGEGIAALNLANTNDRWLFPSGRNMVLYIAEGWYGETGLTLTASDCSIIVTSPGSRIADGTILYGSATQGGFDAGAVIPALRITGSSVSIYGLGFMNSASGLFPCVVVGTQGSSGPVNVLFDSCFWPRDAVDAYTYGLEDLSNEGTVVRNCYFSQSAKTAGVQIASNGVTNPVNNWIINSTFIGTPAGINQDAGHNTKIAHNMFFDATDDRPDVVDTPIVIDATSAFCWNNAGMTTKADLITGTGTINDIGNWGSDSST